MSLKERTEQFGDLKVLAEKPEWMAMREADADLLKTRVMALSDENLDEETWQKESMEIRNNLSERKREDELIAAGMKEELDALDEISTELGEIAGIRRRKRKKLHLPVAPANIQVDREELEQRHFAQGNSVWKQLWVFFIACFAGVLLEQAYCIIQNGHFEPRVGVVIGPFNPLYGLGGVLLTAALYPFRNRSKFFSLLGGMVVGTVLEYVCSFASEKVIGSVSWDYHGYPFNINGRVCLLYSIYWGILGVIWIKSIYPRLACWILKIPNRCGRPLTVVIAVLLSLDLLLTGCALVRWSTRRKGEAPKTAIGVLMDGWFPNERMESLFTNMKFLDDAAAGSGAGGSN